MLEVNKTIKSKSSGAKYSNADIAELLTKLQTEFAFIRTELENSGISENSRIATRSFNVLDETVEKFDESFGKLTRELRFIEGLAIKNSKSINSINTKLYKLMHKEKKEHWITTVYSIIKHRLRTVLFSFVAFLCRISNKYL